MNCLKCKAIGQSGYNCSKCGSLLTLFDMNKIAKALIVKNALNNIK